jgi:hypothetical protein
VLDRLNNPTLDVSQIARHVIRAELIRGDTCTALGIVAEANTPVLQLCRKLIAAGHDPATRLEAYRGDVLSLGVRSLGEAAQLEIDGKGCGFKCRAAVGIASPIALGGLDQP